jgi:hypothetical protein
VILELSKWTTRKNVESGKLPKNSFPVDVSLKGYCMSIFDPLFPHGGIPLPDSKGYTQGLTSDTIQGVWEALAVVNNNIDSSCLHGIPKIRSNPSCNWAYNKTLIPWEEARKCIYIPSFLWVFKNKIPKEIKLAFFNIAKTDVVVYFYDDSENPDPMQRTNDFSHAFLVSQFMNMDFRKIHETDNKLSGLMSIGSNIDMKDLGNELWSKYSGGSF